MTTTAYVSEKVIQRARTIAWATALGAITPEALAERDELNIDVARELLDQAVALELMEKHSILVGYSDLYTVTVAGRRLARKHAGVGEYSYPDGLRTARATIKLARQTIARASVVAALERRYPDHRIISERELYHDEREQKRRLASVDVRHQGETRYHCPDIVIWPPSQPGESQPLPIAVEVELTMKSKEYLRAICRAFARSRYIEVALCYAETTKLEERLLDTIAELKAEEMIVVNPLSEIVRGPLPGFELIPWESEDRSPASR
jgi:hypothetical protein